ncbi:MAG: RloB family protein [Oscillospiraceae bacterium]|nr:RloB family protein [Oscillospiraceae bacterium]
MRKFREPQKRQRNPKIFVITEGTKTEPEYFLMLKEGKRKDIAMEVFSSDGKTNPLQLLEAFKKKLEKYGFDTDCGDEAFLVLDMDYNTPKDFKELLKWEKGSKNCYNIISNPCFEYWLLLHFEDIKGHLTLEKCKEALKRHITDYDKGIDERKFFPNVKMAISRAEKIDSLNKDIPITQRNGSEVFKIVKRLLSL